jgi:hypothetical protein
MVTQSGSMLANSSGCGMRVWLHVTNPSPQVVPCDGRVAAAAKVTARLLLALHFMLAAATCCRCDV